MFNVSVNKNEISVSNKPKSHPKVRENKGQSIIDFTLDYVVIDIETTGFDPYYDAIIELSAIRIINNIQVEHFSSLVKTTKSVSNFITELTGISNDMLSKAPIIKDILPQFYEFIGDSVIVGQNVNFDINFIYDNLMNCVNKG